MALDGLVAQLDDLNVESIVPLVSPNEVREAIPITVNAARTVSAGRNTIQNIIKREDPRMLAIVGPCSIHDVNEAKEYARKLKSLADEVSDEIYVVMRVYFEKPRTTVGWKGLINDPHIDGSSKVHEGLYLARQLLLDIAEIGVPAGTEALDPIAPQYTSDLVSWYAIGARTTESQTHREMASGLSAPTGFKNSTNGDTQIAIDGINSGASRHSFIGINKFGRISLINTKGNAYGHIILRGGNGHANYDEVSIRGAYDRLKTTGVDRYVIVDCSHANSQKKQENQPRVLQAVIDHRLNGLPVMGFMLESNLVEGAQKIPNDLHGFDRRTLEHGKSVTDACIGWETTYEVIHNAYDQLKAGR